MDWKIDILDSRELPDGATRRVVSSASETGENLLRADLPVQCSNRGRLLPIHPHPHDEEIFSNWIVELASANVKSVKEFLDLLEIPLKPRDFETPNDRAIEVLKEVTGSTQDEIALTFPSSFKAVWKKTLPGDRWQYNELCAARVTAPHTLFVCAQYCSRCLALYGCYQVRWRFAIYDCCPIHGLLLRTSCPHCGSQIRDPALLNGQQIMKPRVIPKFVESLRNPSRSLTS